MLGLVLPQVPLSHWQSRTGVCFACRLGRVHGCNSTAAWTSSICRSAAVAPWLGCSSWQLGPVRAALLLQAHHNAQSHSDEFVMSALVSFDKVSALIEDLLVFEVYTVVLLRYDS